MELTATFIVILIAAFVSKGSAQQADQFVCTDSCNSDANSISIASTAAGCCGTTGVSGYYPLLVGASLEQCQECTNLNTLRPQLEISATPPSIVINMAAQLTCEIASDENVGGVLQWLGPDGKLLIESGPNAQSLDLDFDPFRIDDVGDYTCTAQVSSPDFPSNIMSVISRTISFSPPTNLPVSVGITQDQPPIAGDPYTITCTISQEGQTIDWVDSDGNVITSGNGIVVGETMSGGGMTTRTLTFTNLDSSATGRYTCSNPVRNVTQRLVAGFFSPQVDITEPTDPALGEPYQPTCTATLPEDVENGTLTVSWIAPDGTVAASSTTMGRSTSVDLPILSLEASDIGTYICRAVLSSPFLDRDVLSTGTLILQGGIITASPREPVTSSPSQPPPISTTQPSQPPPISTTQPSRPPPSSPQTMTPRPPTSSLSTPLPPLPVNECLLGTDNCSRDQKCFSSYQSGRRQRECVPVARCIDRNDGFECRCNAGFEGDGITCRDINECARGENSCHSDARCLNRPGGFECKCRYGFIGDGEQCCIRREDAERFMDSQGAMDDEDDDDEDETSSRSRRTKHGRHTRTKRRGKSRKSKSKKTKKSRKRTKGTKSGNTILPTEQAPIFQIDENCRAFVIAFNEENSRDTRHRNTRTKSGRRRSHSHSHRG